MRCTALFLAHATIKAASEGLRDHPIVAEKVTYLDGDQWTASTITNGESQSVGLTIPAKVPGDLISDLYAAGQIGNPLYEMNWLNSSIWDHYAWTYATTFE